MLGKVHNLSYPKEIYREISYHYRDEAIAEWRINFQGLQRLVLAKHQEDLMKLVSKLKPDGPDVVATRDEIGQIELVLAKYSE